MRLVLKLLLAFVVITGFSGLIFWTNQQTIRLGAYENIQQLSEDRVAVPATKIDISTSLSPYIMTFDDTGKYVAGNALFENKVPEIPKGVLDYTKTHGQDRITWQPATGVRQVIVVTYFTGKGFTLAGKSLRLTEQRIDLLTKQVALATVAILSASFVLILVAHKPHKK